MPGNPFLRYNEKGGPRGTALDRVDGASKR